MATCNRTSGRTKSSHAKVVVPSWDSVWESFKAETEKTSIDSMNQDGWKTIHQVAEEYGMSRPHIGSMAINGKFDSVRKKIYHAGKTRELVFIRPKIS